MFPPALTGRPLIDTGGRGATLGWYPGIPPTPPSWCPHVVVVALVTDCSCGSVSVLRNCGGDGVPFNTLRGCVHAPRCWTVG